MALLSQYLMTGGFLTTHCSHFSWFEVISVHDVSKYPSGGAGDLLLFLRRAFGEDSFDALEQSYSGIGGSPRVVSR